MSANKSGATSARERVSSRLTSLARLMDRADRLLRPASQPRAATEQSARTVSHVGIEALCEQATDKEQRNNLAIDR